MPHNEEDPIMGNQSTPAPIPQPIFNGKPEWASLPSAASEHDAAHSPL
jgi:hypothetical protein